MAEVEIISQLVKRLGNNTAKLEYGEIIQIVKYCSRLAPPSPCMARFPISKHLRRQASPSSGMARFLASKLL
jgi:hypothetical protein